MEHLGVNYHVDGYDEDKRKTGITVVLFNNNNGKYGYLEFGKEFVGFNAIKLSDEVKEELFKIAVNKQKVKLLLTPIVKHKFKVDFVKGVKEAIDNR